LKDINIELKKGQIHALIGENGAGKSTLMNILFGMSVIHTTGGFEGTIEIEGKQADIKSPHDAMDYGIGMVHQEFMLIPGFTIMENIKLNREITKPNLSEPHIRKTTGNIRYKKNERRHKESLGCVGHGYRRICTGSRPSGGSYAIYRNCKRNR
jgi:simple sugar transport system ATP-binding protein